MSNQVGIYQIYDGEIATMRRGGATLQEIGNYMGVTRERIRQVLKEKYPNTRPIRITETMVAKILGCSDKFLKKLDLVGARKPGKIVRYTPEIIAQAAEILNNLKCEHCGRVRSTRKIKFCDDCSAKARVYYYPFGNEEYKRGHKVSVMKWMSNNKDRVREIQLRAVNKFQRKRAIEQFARNYYIVFRGNHLPLGSIIRVNRFEGGYFILNNGGRIPAGCTMAIRC